MQSRTVPAVLALVAAVLAMTAIWLPFDNPEIEGTSRADSYTCLAPWDTVLNDADNFPGGEPPPDGAEIAARCRDAGDDRFDIAIAAGSAAAVMAVLAAAVPWRRSRKGVDVSG